MTRGRGRRNTKEKLTREAKITLTLKELKDLVKDLTVKITRRVTKSMETKEKTYTRAELKELKEVFNEAYTRNPGTITLTVLELEKLLRASASIHDAAKEGKLDVVKNLLKKNPASLDITNNQGQTPLFLAAREGHLEVVKFFVEEAKADAFIKDKQFGATPLHWSAWNGNLDLVKYLVKINPESIDITNNQGETPLEVAKRCTASSADCSSVVEYLKTLSIHEAAKEGNLGVVKYLLKKNPASVNISNGNGETPVHLAAKKGHLQVVKFLVEEAKADAYFKDKEFGATPLHWSAFKGYLDVVKYLVERNPKSIDIKNNRGETPLEVAKRCSSLDCSSLVEYLNSSKTKLTLKIVSRHFKTYLQKENQYQLFLKRLKLLLSSEKPKKG